MEPDFTGWTSIEGLPTGDNRDPIHIAPGAFTKDLPKTVPFKLETGQVIGEAHLSKDDNGNIVVECSGDPNNPEWQRIVSAVKGEYSVGPNDMVPIGYDPFKPKPKLSPIKRALARAFPKYIKDD